MALIPFPAIPVSLLLAAGLALAQQTPAGEPVLTLRSTTRLVQVEVIVRDKEGKPVSGLTKDDFEIREEHKPQEMRFFSDYKRGPKTAAAELPPGMVSNRPEITGPRRGVTVVLIDSLNTEWSVRARALDNLRKFLKGAQPDDRIAIYTLGNSLKIFQDFNGDARSLQKKLDKYKGGPLSGSSDEPSLLDTLIPEGMPVIQWAEDREAEFKIVNRARATLDTLEKVANHLGSTPGWKSLIWISNGVPLQVGMDLSMQGKTGNGRMVRSAEIRGFSQEFDSAVKALTSSNVAVYPIDPRGLQGLPEYESVGKYLGKTTRPWQETNSMLSHLADRTGGRAYIDQNDILGSLKQVTDAAQTSYTIAYYPSDSNFDGKYRKIEIRVKKDGLKANHRKGYYALDAVEVKKADVQDEIKAAARDPLDAAVIGIDAGIETVSGATQLRARIDTAESLWEEQGVFSVDTAMGLFQYDAEGRQLESVIDRASFQCDAAKAALLSQHGLSYGRKIAVSPAATKLRLVVRSARTGAIGSITIPVAR